MADYYPVLKRAISSLPPGSGEARRAVYEKARAALLRQLNSYNPPLSPEEIGDQRATLEECIRRVEAETAGPSLGFAPEPPPTPRPVAPPEPAPVEAAPLPAPEPVVPRPVEIRVAAPTLASPRPVDSPRQPAQAKPIDPLMDARVGAGLSALTKTLRQADSLGEASATAVRAARSAIEDEVPPPSASRIEPEFPPEPPLEPVAPPPARKGKLRQEPAVDVAPPVDEHSIRPAAREPAAGMPWPIDDQSARKRKRLVLAAAAVLLLGLGGASALWFSGLIGPGTPEIAATPEAAKPDVAANAPPTDGGAPKILDRLPQEGEATPVAPDAHAVATETVASAPVIDPDMPPQPATTPAAASPEPTPSATALAPATQTPAASAQDSPAATPDTAAPTTPTVPDSPAPADTPAAAAPPAPATTTADSASQGVLVAQKAILYEEPIPGSPASKLEGRILWSLVNEPPLPGEKAVPQIRADVEIPDLKLKLQVSIHKNDDQGLPASHIVELKFDIPAAFPGRSIDMTPGLIAKQSEEARGDPVIGAVAKVSDNLYWLALSGLEQDTTRNIALLKEREWIDIPIRYGNRRRAILTFEKGAQGDQVFADAFKLWGQ